MIAPKIHDFQRLFEKELLGQLHEENMRLARATKKQKEKHRDRRGRLQRLRRHLRERSPMSLKKRSMNFRSMSLRVGRKLTGIFPWIATVTLYGGEADIAGWIRR